MSAETNLELVKEYLAEHNPALVAEEAAFIDQCMPTSVTGPDAIGALLYEMYHVSFPGAEAVSTRLDAGERSVTLEFTFTGKNDGPFLGSPGTGRRVSVPMCAVYQVADGQIVEIRLYYDSATLTCQLGLPPLPGRPLTTRAVPTADLGRS
jgi:steroid delta-isomerase-like uncharacterized protein